MNACAKESGGKASVPAMLSFQVVVERQVYPLPLTTNRIAISCSSTRAFFDKSLCC